MSLRSFGPKSKNHPATTLGLEALETRDVPDATPHNLAGSDFSQNWSNTGPLLTTADNWSQVPSVVGYLGDGTGAGTSGATDPWNVTTDSTSVDLVPNSTAGASGGGVHEIEASQVVALQGSSTARSPYLQIHFDATGRQNLKVSYLLRELDADNANQKFALQYRVGTSGAWTDIFSARVSDVFNAAGAQTAGITNAALPSAVNNQPQVQIRIITTDAQGSDSMVGVDDIVVTSDAIATGNQPPAITLPGGPVSYTENASAAVLDADATVTDADSGNFDTGTLTVTISSNGSADDRLAIFNQGTAAGQIGVSGSNVTFGGTTIGTFAGGTGTTALVVTFNASATPAAVQALVRNITFQNVSDNPTTAPRSVQFVVTDGDGGTSNTATKTVNVVAVNDAPVVTTSGSATAATEQVAVAIDAGLTVADVDSANLTSATVSITGGFATGQDVLGFADQNGITGSYNAGTGVLTLTGTATVAQYQTALQSVTYSNTSDNPATANRTISFVVNDGTVNSTGANKTVTVAAVNDAPTITSPTGTPAAVSVPENTTAVVAVAATDPDGPSITYSIVPAASGGGADAARFTINSSTGALAFVTAPDFETPTDAGLNNVYDVTVQASDGSLTATRTIAVTVTDVAAGTFAFSSAAYTVTEGNSGTTPATITVTRTGGTDVAFVSFSAGASGGTATGGSDYTATAGNLTFGVGVNSQTFTVSVFGDTTFELDETVNLSLDNPSPTGGGANAATIGAPGTAVLTITNDDAAANQPPMSTAPMAVTTNEDTPLAFTGANAISVADPDATPGNLSVTLTLPADRGTLTASAGSGGATVTGGGGTGTATVVISGSAAAVNAALATLAYTPLANGNTATFGGTVPLTVTTADALLATDTETVAITVTAVNDPPTITVGTPPAPLEDAGPQTVTNLAAFQPGPATATDEAGQTITYTVTPTGTPGGLTFTSAPAISPTGTLTYTAAANSNGTATFTVTATDSGGATSAPQPLTITVTAVNDLPSFTLAGNRTVGEDAVAQTVNGFVTSASPGPANEAGQTLTYTVTNNNNALFSVQPAIDASGRLTFTPAANASGTATVSVFVTDSGGTANGGQNTSGTQMFTITVTPVADTPSVTNAATNEDTQTTSGLVVTRNAADGTEVGFFKITGITNGTLFLSDGTTAVANGTFITTAQGAAGLKFTPAANFFGTGSFQVQASTGDTDAGLGGSPVTATVTVNPVADTPNFTGATTPEDTQVAITAGTRNAADGTEVTSFQVTGITGGALFLADGTTPVNNGDFLAFGTALTFTPAPDRNDLVGPSGFRVQASTDGTAAGLGGSVVPVVVTVTPVNDAPTLTVTSGNVTVAQDSGAFAQSGFASFSPGGGSDEAGQTATYTATASNPALFSAQPALDANGRLTFTPAPGASGTATVTVTVRDSGGTANGGVDVSGTRPFTITITPAPVVTPPSPTPPAQAVATAQFIAIGTDAGTLGTVRVLDAATRNPVREFVPFAGFAGGVRVALADVTGDGKDDLIVGTATGGSHVKVFDIGTGAELRSFFAFPGFAGGVDVAAGDTDGDGRADVIVGAGPGAPGGHVKVFDIGTGAELQSFLAFPGFLGGVKVAAGDVTGDGRADVAVLAGPGGNGHVKVFNGATGAAETSFFGYAGYAGDIDLAVGDANGDGFGDVITTAQNPAAGTHVKAFDRTARTVRSFFAPVGAPADPGPGFVRGAGAAAAPTAAARVAAGDVNGDRVAEYLLGTQPRAGVSKFVLINGATQTALDSGFAFDPLFGLGVFVDV